jgi:hypothetical protein
MSVKGMFLFGADFFCGVEGLHQTLVMDMLTCGSLFHQRCLWSSMPEEDEASTPLHLQSVTMTNSYKKGTVVTKHGLTLKASGHC